MFRSIKELIDRIRSPDKERPQYGLTEQDIQHLHKLQDDRSFKIYLKALDSHAKLITDALLSSTDSYNDTLHKGILIGLHKAGTLVDEIIQQRHHARESQRRRSESLDRGADRLQRAAALYGSPGWGKTTTK